AEIKRTRWSWPNPPAADPTNYIDQMNLVAPASMSLIAPTAACTTPTSRITYRGNQYYRNIIQTTNYSHTVPPNSKISDCGDTSIISSHVAARSYHPGGVNVAFADGTVRFIKDSVNILVWRALGSRAGGEVVSADAF